MLHSPTAPITIVAETSEIVKFADTIAIVVDISSVSLRNLHILKEEFKNKNISNLGIIVNKYNLSNLPYARRATYTAYTIQS